MKKTKLENIVVISKDEVKHHHIIQALKLDMISYEDEYHLKAETCISYFEKNNYIYTMALDIKTNQIVGYINFSPITKKMYNNLLSGKVIDDVISQNDIVKYRANKDCWAYFSSIVVSPLYRNKGIASIMINEWQNLVCELATEYNIYFKGILADAVTGGGEQVLNKLGFELSKQSSHDSKVMTIDLFSKNTKKTKYNEKIIELYRKRSI